MRHLFFFFVIFIGFVEIHTPFCLLPLCHTSLLSISIWLNRRLWRERWGRVIGSVGELSWSYHIRGSRWVKYYTTNLATDTEGASYVCIAFQSNLESTEEGPGIWICDSLSPILARALYMSSKPCAVNCFPQDRYLHFSPRASDQTKIELGLPATRWVEDLGFGSVSICNSAPASDQNKGWTAIPKLSSCKTQPPNKSCDTLLCSPPISL